MIAELAAPKQLVPVATGHSTNGQPYAVTVAPDYTSYVSACVAYQQRLIGAAFYRQIQPIEACTNDDQRSGWREEEDWYKGQAQYLRALELDNLPASWADPYIAKPTNIHTDW